MKPCWCKLLLAILVIVFIWWNPSWAKIGITIAAAIIAILSLSGTCCCSDKKCDKKE